MASLYPPTRFTRNGRSCDSRVAGSNLRNQNVAANAPFQTHLDDAPLLHALFKLRPRRDQAAALLRAVRTAHLVRTLYWRTIKAADFRVLRTAVFSGAAAVIVQRRYTMWRRTMLRRYLCDLAHALKSCQDTRRVLVYFVRLNGELAEELEAESCEDAATSRRSMQQLIQKVVDDIEQLLAPTRLATSIETAGKLDISPISTFGPDQGKNLKS